MSEAGLRLLDRDLPRLNMLAPGFAARVRAERRGRQVQLAGNEKAKAKVIRDATHEALALVRSAKREAERIIAEAKKGAVESVEAARAEAAAMLRAVGLDPEKTPAAEIMRQVADKHGVRVADITGPARSACLVAIRHEAIAKVYEARPDMSLPQIGRIFGNRDHTTILHAVRKLGVYRGLNGYAKQQGRSE